VQKIKPKRILINNKANNMKQIILPKELENWQNELQSTVRQYIKITASPEMDTLPTASKFGGSPYWPVDMEFPVNSAGKPLSLLAQINFEEVPHTPDFPTSGILQFFVIPNMKSNYGCALKTVFPPKQNNFRVVYHPKIGVNKLITPIKPGKSFSFPVEKECKLTFQLDEEPISPKDFIEWNLQFPQFNSYYKDLQEATEKDKKYFEKCFWQDGMSLTKYYFFKKDSNISNKYEEFYRKWINHKMGGYAYFAQEDSRYKHPEYDTLLFQMKTDKNVSWGDTGIAHIFIQKADLKALDFSKVYYSWSCY
jgi:uncharacterized protein YwqG